MTQHGIRLPNDKNPAAAVERYREAAPVIQFLTLEQIDQQLNALIDKPQLQAMVATLIYAGLRREELVWLTQEDIDWNAKGNGLIRIRAKEIGGESWQPKTKVNRVVPISSSLRPYLDRQRLKSGKGPWFFPSPDGKRWEPDNFSADLRAANKKKGLSEGWSNLTFRHTFGSQLAIRGESLYKIATLMGNSPAICQRHYAALIPEALADCVEFSTKPQTPLALAAAG
jgi:integrase